MVGMLGIPTHSKHVGKENREIQPNHHPKAPIIFFYGMQTMLHIYFMSPQAFVGKEKLRLDFLKNYDLI